MANVLATRLRNVPVAELYAERSSIDVNPPYQRESDLWKLPQKRLLIDSLLNGFDIPKIYVHRFSNPILADDAQPKIGAVIDGKQRLETIWSFFEDGFTLGPDFVFFDDPDLDVGLLRYSELSERVPWLRARLDGAELTIVDVHTEDTDLLEDLFTRLNTSSQLTAGELRNALGGAVPPALRELAKHRFFTRRVSFDISRYRDRDMAVKFLYIASQDSFASTKKGDLDEWVIAHRASRELARTDGSQKRQSSLDRWQREKRRLERDVRGYAVVAKSILDRMSGFFIPHDDLLSRQGDVVLFFHLFRLLGSDDVPAGLTREALRGFRSAVDAVRDKQNRLAGGSQEQLTRRENLLAGFLRHSQSLNDGPAQLDRYRLLRRDLLDQHGIELPDPEA